MNVIFPRPQFFPAVLLILLAALSAFSQPTLSQKQIDAKAAFDEGIKLRAEGTYRSYEKALERFQTSARLYEELGDRGNVGSALLGVGLIKNLLDENDAALENYLNALAIFREIRHLGLEARTLNNIGNLYSDTGEKQKALECHFLALALRKIIDDRHGEGLTLNSIGSVYGGLGERQKALDYFNRSLVIRRELSEQAEQAITLNNIGLTYDQLGHKQKALEYLNQSLTLRKAAGDRIGEATTLNNLGMVTADVSEPAKAIEYYRQSLAIFSTLGLENMKASVLNNMGVAYLNLGEPKKALEFNRQALPLYQAAGSRSGAATTINNIGNANLELGNVTQALADLNQALVLGKASQEKELEAIILGNLMRASKKAGQLPTAIFYGKQSINKYQELRRSIRDLDAEIQRTYLAAKENCYRSLAELLIEAGLFAQAEQVLRMLKEDEYFEFVGRDASEIKNLGRQIVLTSKEQELIKRYSALAGRVTEMGLEFSRLDEKKRRLSRTDGILSAEEQITYEKLSAQLADANSAFKLFLEKQLAGELGRTETKKIEYDRSLQDKLVKMGAGTVALYTVVTRDRYRVILTTPTVQVDGKFEIKGADLNKKIFAFREALRNRAVDPRPAGKELYDILIKPVEKELQAAGAKTLLWSLDGALRYIPLSALSPDGKTYLGEKYAGAILTPKTRDDLSLSRSEWRILGLGVSESLNVIDPADEKKTINFVALPGAKKELTQLVRDESATPKIGETVETGILSGRRYLDKDFTRNILTDSLAAETADGKRKFTVVHIASHFNLGDDWSTSFLVLGDGRALTLEQISSSPEINFSDVELITLSACNTAFTFYSNGREIDSLAEAIQTKNGKAVLATLWAISDEGTSPLMSEFYRARKENPELTKAEAMRAAQKAMIEGRVSVDPEQAKRMKPDISGIKAPAIAFPFDENKPFAHPYYWSPFILYGNWR